ncbi:hypothetical protein BJ138DRAFT_1234046 [Hygrophoropsis aurantiaca]|uniref:Uncharacterized protein n=1 Tax=Hygrophoropsis aurantiaca TaxID=72124 RepID=A0ACB7ZVP8_9AGAM|nr:hypothetical protein BJ138DRAFT_1234046 [Hygrophoropsis aurantiaca]
MPQNVPRTHTSRRSVYNGRLLPCTYPGCTRYFKNQSGLTQHLNSPLTHARLQTRHNQLPRSSDYSAPLGSEPISQDVPVDTDANNVPLDDVMMDDEAQPHSSPPRSSQGSPGPKKRIRDYHEELDGKPCDENGTFIDPSTPPTPRTSRASDDWTPYQSRTEFELAEFLFTRNQMPAGQINTLMDLIKVLLLQKGDNDLEPPFTDHKDLYETIDSTPLGDVAWNTFSVSYQGEKPPEDVPPWMNASYEVCYRDPREILRNMLANPDFDGDIDYAPYRDFDANENREYQNLMSGDWAWKQADIIARDPATHGSTFVPVILGSDKTTVSVATGQTDYYPLYISIGNVHNNVRRAHRNAVAVIGFLAMPKTDKEHSASEAFRRFRRQIFHTSLSKILETLRDSMTVPEVARCADGHYRRIIYGLGPYIADYEEQVLLACVVKDWCGRCYAYPDRLDDLEGGTKRSREHVDALVNEFDLKILWNQFGVVGDLVPFTNDFPRADIHELLAPDILHQLIKGTFKDHLVTWVQDYLELRHGKADAAKILDDIDRRIAAVAPCAGLRRFPDGRGFKQWTGDDSKALMKVYLPAIEGHVPSGVVRTFRAFLEFCYIARQDYHTEKSLAQLKDALERFHKYRAVFTTLGVRLHLSLPRQHSMSHYLTLIRLFGSPNGLCSSITESKHIKAVKEPWRRSSHFAALSQMLLTNQRLDKIAASRVDFENRGMLPGSCISERLVQLGLVLTPNTANTQPPAPSQQTPGPHTTSNAPQESGDGSQEDTETIDGPTVQAHVDLARTPQRNRAKNMCALADELGEKHLPKHVRYFLHTQIHPEDPRSADEISQSELPCLDEKISIFHSAGATFYAPSDPSGIGGMKREHIRATPSWRKLYPRYDCVFVNVDPELDGMRGLDVARVLCFFSFTFEDKTYPAAVVHSFSRIGDEPDENTGMWKVEPLFNENGSRRISIIHVDTIFRAAHLIPVYGSKPLPKAIKHYHSYDLFNAYYVNKYADHHAFTIAW